MRVLIEGRRFDRWMFKELGFYLGSMWELVIGG